MKATLPPRPARAASAQPRGFGWGWLGACLALLALLAWLLVREAGIGREKRIAPLAREAARGRPAALEANPPGEPERESTRAADSIAKTSAQAGSLANGTTSVAGQARIFSHEATLPSVGNTQALRGGPAGGIEAEFVKSPIYMLADGQSAKAFTPGTWLRVVVPFQSAAPRLAELTFRYRIQLGDELFLGQLTCVEILGEGTHRAAAYLIPSAVEPLIGRADFRVERALWIEVEAVHRDALVFRSSLGKPPAAPGRLRPGLLRSVEETPFAPLEIDLYERTVP